MDWTALIIWYLIVGALLGLIPAFIASNKGRSFGAWYIYGFCLFIFAFFHALLIPNTESQNSPRDEVLTKQLECLPASGEKDHVVTTDLNSPVDILNYSLSKDADGSVFLSLELQAVEKAEICAVKLEAVGFNSFNDVVNVDEKDSFQILIQDANITSDKSYYTERIKLPNNDIRRLQFTVLQTVTDTGEVVQNTPDMVTYTLRTLAEDDAIALKECKPEYKNARYYPEEHDGFWVCPCGRANNTGKCPRCGIVHSDVLFSDFTLESLEKFNEVKQNKGNQMQKTKKKETKIAISIVASVLAITIISFIAASFFNGQEYKSAEIDKLQGYWHTDRDILCSFLSINGTTVSGRRHSSDNALGYETLKCTIAGKHRLECDESEFYDKVVYVYRDFNDTIYCYDYEDGVVKHSTQYVRTNKAYSERCGN